MSGELSGDIFKPLDRFIHVFPKNVELNHRNERETQTTSREKKKKKKKKKKNTFDRRPHEDACLFRIGAACLLACVSHRKRFPAAIKIVDGRDPRGHTDFLAPSRNISDHFFSSFCTIEDSHGAKKGSCCVSSRNFFLLLLLLLFS